MQTPLQLNIWLQSYAGFNNSNNIIKQINLNPVFANISKTTSPTSDSFLLIMSYIMEQQRTKLYTLLKREHKFGNLLSYGKINPSTSYALVVTMTSLDLAKVYKLQVWAVQLLQFENII